MSRFKDRLWRELVREHGHHLAQMRRPPAKRSRRARPRVLAGTGLGLVGVGATAALVLGAASTSPAFAVTRNHDGTVQVKIFKSAGIAGANAKLAALGVRARVVRLTASCVRAPLMLPAAPLRRAARQVRIDPRMIPAGRTLTIASFRKGNYIDVAPAPAIRGKVPDCLMPPLPPVCGAGRVAGTPSRQVPARQSRNRAITVLRALRRGSLPQVSVKCGARNYHMGPSGKGGNQR